MTGKRIVYYDVLNIVACICVVAMHCNVMVHTYAPGWNWILGMAIESACYFAVPIFFMISGANLMRYRERYDTKTFLKKRFVKTLVPLLAFSVLIYLYRFGFHHPDPGFGVAQFVSYFFSSQIESTYWFFFPLFGMYLSMPLLSLLADHRKVLVYAVGVAFACQSVGPYVLPALGWGSWNPDFDIAAASGYLMYAILGFLIAEGDMPRRTRLAVYALGLFGLLFRFGYTLAFSEAAGAVDRTYFTYLAFPAVLYSVAVFTWFKYRDWSPVAARPKLCRALSRVSSCSFGVYLMHNVVLAGVAFNFLGIPETSVLLRVVGPFALYLACLAAVLVMKRIPVVRRMVP